MPGSATPLPPRHLLILFVAAVLLLFMGLGALPLIEPDEGRNAEVAREMLSTGDWVTPHYNSFVYLDKPAVFFWMVSGSLKLLGVSEGAARLPSALMALSTVLLAWRLGRRMFDQAAGLRAGVILATSPLFLALARFVTFDMTLAFFVTLAMASFWWAEECEHSSLGYDALMFAALGLGAITKGPVGFLLPLLSIVVFQALRGKLGDLKNIHWGLGVVVFLAVAAPWFVAVCLRHPDFPRYAFWQESLRRFATGRAHRTGSFAYYIPIYFAGFFPWSWFLLLAGWNHLREWRKLREESHKSVMFLLAWAGVVFLFFSISRSKLPAYFLPALVPLGLLLAQAWSEVGRPAAHPPDWLTAGFAGLLVLGLLAGFGAHFLFPDSLRRQLAKKLHPAFLATIQPSLFYSGIILAALAVVGRNIARRSKASRLSAWTFSLTALVVPCLAARWVAPLKTYAATASSRSLAAALLSSPEKDLPLYGYYYFRTGLPFYLGRPVGLVTLDADEMTSNYVSGRWTELGGPGAMTGSGVSSSFNRGDFPLGTARAPGSPDPVLIDDAGLRALAFRGPILLMARHNHVPGLAKTFPEMEPLWSSWEYSVWKVSTVEPRR